MVVYDPNDPHADLYDVDDGKSLLSLVICLWRIERILQTLLFGRCKIGITSRLLVRHSRES